MHRWKFSALATAACLSAALTTTEASALTLGRLAVQSALGEPLRAEIEVPQITSAEADSLVTAIASAEVFRVRGMDYNSVARQIQIQLQRRADGTAVLRLSSPQPVNDPFVDLVLDASWHAGHVVRSYTVLLDPPARNRPAPAVTAPAQTPAAAAPATAAAAASSPRAAAANPAPSTAATPTAAPSTAPTKTADTVKVQRGATAGQLAQAHRPSGVSLDQMLVALLQANPDAFVQGNVNRLKTGAVLDIPSRDTALSTSPKEARQIIAAQSRDFNDFRRRLASQAPQAAVAAAERSASGTVQAQVDDRSANTGTPDKLTLSKGALPAQAAADEKLAQQKQANDQGSRLNELQRNLAELSQVAAASGAAAAPAGTAAAPAAPATGTEPPAAGLASSLPGATAGGDTAPPPAADSPAPAEASAPAEAPAPTPAPAAPAPVATPAAAAPAEPSLADSLLENPLLPAAGGILALLLGWVGYRSVQRRKAQTAATAAGADSQLHPDSFFGSSGGQQVDTSNTPAEGGTTMAYSPSQLDAGGDVDPVAEADVYLAYGREDQAEEILQEAQRSQPERLSVHLKLAELYAKRLDAQALETTARNVKALTQGQGPDWEHVQDLGRRLDPAQPLYQRSEDTAPAQVAAVAAAAAMVAALPPLEQERDEPTFDAEPEPVAEPILSAETPPSPTEADYAALEPDWEPVLSADSPPPSVLPLDLDLNLDLPGADSPEAAQDETLLSLAELPDLALEGTAEPVLEDSPAALPPAAEPPAPAPVVAAASAVEPLDQGLDFDLSGLDLGPDSAPAPTAHAPADDPLATKLALAQEFQAIGDSEGARSLIEEVIADASGDLKTRAQRLLEEIA